MWFLYMKPNQATHFFKLVTHLKWYCDVYDLNLILKHEQWGHSMYEWPLQTPNADVFCLLKPQNIGFLARWLSRWPVSQGWMQRPCFAASLHLDFFAALCKKYCQPPLLPLSLLVDTPIVSVSVTLFSGYCYQDFQKTWPRFKLIWDL